MIDRQDEEEEVVDEVGNTGLGAVTCLVSQQPIRGLHAFRSFALRNPELFPAAARLAA